MTNLVSGLSIGNTFAGGGRITNVSAAIIEQPTGSAGFSILGAVITDPNNNVVLQIPLTAIEAIPPKSYAVNCPVGLNFSMYVVTSNSAV